MVEICIINHVSAHPKAYVSPPKNGIIHIDVASSYIHRI